MKHLSLVFCLIFLTSSLAWGVKGPAKVSAGPHNLSGSTSPTPGPSPFTYNTDEDSLCVFCHTPHGGSLDAPLWNRNNPAPSGGWKHYNSATMSTAIKGLSTSRPPGPESLLCLSCHDGSISVNHVINEPNDRVVPIESESSGNPDTTIIDFFGYPGSRIGGELGANSGGEGFLTDDHPISFSYSAVVGSAEYLPGGAKANQLIPVDDVIINDDVRFFGATNRVECSSCHDPHVDYSASGNPLYAPFLITPNTGSLLCLACHIK